ncbi:uncharacterized protein [Amphiura filiformis]|uniref:uncharacterized protein n=1 Tax=Amphiura filiformis TaxID=82378 RepID=UPI003B21173F
MDDTLAFPGIQSMGPTDASIPETPISMLHIDTLLIIFNYVTLFDKLAAMRNDTDTQSKEDPADLYWNWNTAAVLSFRRRVTDKYDISKELRIYAPAWILKTCISQTFLRL